MEWFNLCTSMLACGIAFRGAVMGGTLFCRALGTCDQDRLPATKCKYSLARQCADLRDAKMQKICQYVLT